MTPIEFIKLAGNGGRIVSSNDLTVLQIAEAQACNRFYVDPDTSFGWAVLPWHCTTAKDRSREDAIFNRILPPEVAAAMEIFNGKPPVLSSDEWYSRLKESAFIIATHFTKLFQKGNQP